jgi:hypothetical protein
VGFFKLEAPFYFLFLLCYMGTVNGRRSCGQRLRNQMYLESLSNSTAIDFTGVPTTTAIPIPVAAVPHHAEGVDYKGSGFLDVFWKLSAPPVTVTPASPSSTTTRRTTTHSCFSVFYYYAQDNNNIASPDNNNIASPDNNDIKVFDPVGNH